MSESAENIKAIADFFRQQATRPGRPQQFVERYNEYADNLEAARDRLIHLEGLTSSLPPDLGNIHDLPPELLEELTVAKTDELEDQLVTVINAYGGEASLDQILVGLYRKFKVVQKRRFVQNKLYRMPSVWSVEGRKGYYTTTEPEDSPSASGPAYDATFRVDTVPYDDDEEIPF